MLLALAMVIIWPGLSGHVDQLRVRVEGQARDRVIRQLAAQPDDDAPAHESAAPPARGFGPDMRDTLVPNGYLRGAGRLFVDEKPGSFRGLVRDAELAAQIASSVPANRRAGECRQSPVAEHAFHGLNTSRTAYAADRPARPEVWA